MEGEWHFITSVEFDGVNEVWIKPVVPPTGQGWGEQWPPLYIFAACLGAHHRKQEKMMFLSVFVCLYYFVSSCLSVVLAKYIVV